MYKNKCHVNMLITAHMHFVHWVYFRINPPQNRHEIKPFRGFRGRRIHFWGSRKSEINTSGVTKILNFRLPVRLFELYSVFSTFF